MVWTEQSCLSIDGESQHATHRREDKWTTSGQHRSTHTTQTQWQLHQAGYYSYALQLNTHTHEQKGESVNAQKQLKQQ